MNASQNCDPARVGQIVVGVDGSPEALAALRWAIGHAQERGLLLRVVTAWGHPQETTFGDMHSEDDPVPLMTAEEILASAIADAGLPVEDSNVTTVRVLGHPAEVLIQESEDADLLVIGTHGHRRIVGALLGSVSQYVAAHAACPVVLVRLPAHDHNHA